MSVQTVVARVAELQTIINPAAVPPPAPAPAAGQPGFAGLLQSAMAPGAVASTASLGALPTTGGAGSAIVAAAQGEVGQAEQPPGSNDSPRIAMYRTATPGSGVGPWCGYFVSWAARQAGVPIGDQGEGMGSVDAIYAWAQRTGRAVPAGSGQPPQPGDLIVWDEHIGVVEGVDPNGSIHTIEGNSSDRVSRRTYGPDGGGAVGYVHLG